MPDVMKTVGRYEILREVGRGGMAMVYLARQTDLDRFVALKELGAFHASDPSFAQRFLRESRVAGSLSHPNICTVHDYFEHDGTPYIAMEYIERGSLRPYVGTMNLAQIGGVLEGLLAGLAHGEQHGIVHRDLKPENLMVTSDGRVKIADFGIAKATNNMQTGAFLTATGTTVGTPTYMAPEQAMAQDIGPPTDLYSVGCMAFEMFTGRVPFHDTEAPMAILLRHVNEQIPSVKSIDPQVDQDISDWIDRLLVKDPKQRTQYANDAWDEFEEIIIGLLGPRWRREARLREGSAQFDTPAPLTPAPFQGTTADAAVSDEFQSFAWGNAVTPEQAPPGPATPPPSESIPVPPEPVVGPPTPEPGPAVAADGSGPATSDDVDAGFVTFGAPAAEPESPPEADAPPVESGDPLTAEPEAEAAAPVQPTEPSTQPTEPSEQPEEEGSFETYIAPAPLRPPTDDQEEPTVVPEPPAPEPEPIPEPAAAAPPPPAPVPRLRPHRPRRRSPPQDDLAATVMPSSVTPPPAAPVEEKPKPVERGARAREARQAPKERKGGKGALIGFGIAAVIAAVLGFVIGGGSGGSEDEGGGAPTVAASNADVEAKFPSDWKKISDVAGDPGHAVRLADRAGARRRRGRREHRRRPGQERQQLDAAAGRLPHRARARLGRAARRARRFGSRTTSSRPTATRTSARDGLDQPVTLYTVPTSAGVATVACVDPSADCESIANTLKLNAGTAFPVGPSKAYAAGLGKTLGTLDKKVSAGRKALAGRGHPEGAGGRGEGPLGRVQERLGVGLEARGLARRRRRQRSSSRRRSRTPATPTARSARPRRRATAAPTRRPASRLRTREQAVAGALRGLEAAGYKIAE